MWALVLLLAHLAGCESGGSVRLKADTMHLSQWLFTCVLILRSRLCWASWVCSYVRVVLSSKSDVRLDVSTEAPG